MAVLTTLTLLAGCGGGGGGNIDTTELVKLLTTSVPGGTTGVEYHAQFDAEFPNPPGKYTVVGGELPTGLVLDKNTGALTGYPRQVGAFSFTVAARDGVDPNLPPARDKTFAEDRKTFSLTVLRGPPNVLPQTLPAAQYRASYGYQIDVAGGTPPYTFTWTGELPEGVTVNPSGFVGSFPTKAKPTPYVFQVTVRDAQNLTDTETLELQIVVLPLIIATASPLPPAAKDFAYTLQMTLASGGAGVPYIWSQAPLGAGEVALSSIGMEITAQGVLRNLSPATGPTVLGTHKFTLQVQDEAQQVTSRQYEITVNPGPVLTLITPNKSAKPGPYTATGLNFAPGAQLIFKPGPTEIAITPTYQSPTLLTFANAPSAPAGAGGFVTVRVRNPDGGFYDLPSAFAFPASNLTFSTTPSFPTPQSNLSSTGLAVADVNKDGYADVAHCGSSSAAGQWSGVTGTSGGVDLLINLHPGGTYDGSFSRIQFEIGGEWHQVKFVDVDSDGDLDLVAVGRVGSEMRSRTWKNPYPAAWTTPGAFLDSSLPFSSFYTIHVSDMALGRFTNDAIPDLAYVQQDVTTTTSSSWQLFGGAVATVRGAGNGTFSTPLGTASQSGSPIFDMAYAAGVATGSLDGDGVDDIAVGDQAGGLGPWNTGTGTNNSGQFAMTVPATGIFGTFAPVVRPGQAGITENLGIAIGDVSGDGFNDVLTAAGGNSWNGTPGIGVFQGNGSGTFTGVTPQNGASGAKYRYISTFDGDFDIPLDAAASADAGRIDVWKGRTGTNGLQWKQTITLASGSPNMGRIASGDFNNDGRDDLCAALSFLADAQYGHQTPNPRGLGGTQGVVIYLNTSQ